MILHSSDIGGVPTSEWRYNIGIGEEKIMYNCFWWWIICKNMLLSCTFQLMIQRTLHFAGWNRYTWWCHNFANTHHQPEAVPRSVGFSIDFLWIIILIHLNTTVVTSRLELTFPKFHAFKTHQSMVLSCLVFCLCFLLFQGSWTREVSWRQSVLDLRRPLTHLFV